MTTSPKSSERIMGAVILLAGVISVFWAYINKDFMKITSATQSSVLITFIGFWSYTIYAGGRMFMGKDPTQLPWRKKDDEK